ncbi:DNA methyltransferase [Erwinia phage vB_EamM_Caitlin]|uniref:DNA methyltransferase n=1 Tax=Erwinia phage vB_EamM_Caitlin TaxID=1883379 RepID=UPI00081C39EB|nr:DNA methyltransferase [Erwinia phage vB_EamM_Caitlin]ANZ48411.1 putative DNA adenine methylase [Erwinia phage vB_EamM_Caitlin]
MQRAILKWVGGKGRVLSSLKKILPAGDCLVEPFVGSGSVFLNTDYAQYRLSDSNPDLILVLRVASEAPEDLIEACEELWGQGFDGDTYAKLKKKFNDRTNVTIEDSIDRAALFIYLNRHGFNGLCRYNNSGIYNVPHGKLEAAPYLPREEIRAFWKKCTECEVIITCQDFAEALATVPKNAVVYADPPYVPRTKTEAFTQYHKAPFNQQHHRTLAKLLKAAHAGGAKVVLSNSDTLLTKDIYYGFDWQTVVVGRYVGAKADKRGKVNELIGILK